MRTLQYAVDIIVGTIHRGEWAWFVSEKDPWFLDQEKLSRAFERKGYHVQHDSRDSTRVRSVDDSSADEFLESMRPYRVTVEELRSMINAKLPVESWEDIAELVPSLYVNFDDRTLLSLYSEPASFEDYVPDGWEGRYDNFLHLVPEDQQYWVTNGSNVFAALMT